MYPTLYHFRKSDELLHKIIITDPVLKGHAALPNRLAAANHTCDLLLFGHFHVLHPLFTRVSQSVLPLTVVGVSYFYLKVSHEHHDSKLGSPQYCHAHP